MSIATRNGHKNRIADLEPAEPSKVVKKEVIRVSQPNMRTLALNITGTAPLLQCRFSQKAMNQMMAKQMEGDKQTAGKKKVRSARDYEADFQGAIHRINKTTYGIPAAAFRNAAISACRLVNIHMTMAKLSIFVEADGYDVIDQMPLVKINGKPEKHISIGRNADLSCDIRARAIYKEWSAVLRVRFDEDQFSATDVVNLIMRVGSQVGVGEGRPDSRKSAGMGFGLFKVELEG